MEEESQRHFVETKNKHSAIETNINELEYRWLDRCADPGYPHFRRYVGLGVCAYNLRKIGTQLIAQDRRDVQQENHAKKTGINLHNIRNGSSAVLRHAVIY